MSDTKKGNNGECMRSKWKMRKNNITQNRNSFLKDVDLNDDEGKIGLTNGLPYTYVKIITRKMRASVCVCVCAAH